MTATTTTDHFRRRTLLAGLAMLPALAARAAENPVTIGVSGPLSGQYAQYGADWRRGFDLTVAEVNGSGGIGGRPLAYRFEDSQSDPRQTVAIAQKFVADPAIVAELGDFSSAASMAASPIYQRNHLVQFGFTNSHPDFTRGGDYMWSNAPNQADDMPVLAGYAAKLGFKRMALAYINSDWGRTSKDLFSRPRPRAAAIAAAESYLPTSRISARCWSACAMPSRTGSCWSPTTPTAPCWCARRATPGWPCRSSPPGRCIRRNSSNWPGPAADGVYTNTNFFPADPRPAVQRFVTAYKAAYAGEPGFYAARGYDAMMLLATVMRQFGTGRTEIRDGLAKVKDVPSVLFGSVTFDPDTRRVRHPASIDLVVRDGAFALWDGKPAISG